MHIVLYTNFTLDPVRPIATSNQTAVLGSNISLYCINHSKLSSTGNLWYKDGTPLNTNSQAFDWLLVGPMGEVLLLNNVTIDTGGVYSCINEEGLSITSTLTVLGKLMCSNYRGYRNCDIFPPRASSG